jgi:hypothetical protein
VRIAVVVVDTKVRELGVDDKPEVFAKLVGGKAERLPVGDYTVGYLNADAGGLPPNPLADRLLAQLGVAVDGVRGPLVLVGLFAGRHTDAPGIVRDTARRLG